MGRITKWLFGISVVFAVFAAKAHADLIPAAAAAATAASAINAGDTAWLLMSSALVLLMTPALAFFYGGLVRKKNVS